MRLFLRAFTAGMLFLLVPSFAQTSNDVYNQAIGLQYSSPKVAITLLEDHQSQLINESNEAFFKEQLLLFSLYHKIHAVKLANITLANIEQRLEKEIEYHDWLIVLNTMQLVSIQQNSTAFKLISTINPTTIEKKSNTFKMWYFYNLGRVATRQNNYDVALINLNKVKPLAILLDNKYFEMAMLDQHITINYYRSDYQKALGNSDELLQIALNVDDMYMQTIAYSSQMNSYYYYATEKQNVLDNMEEIEDKKEKIKLQNIISDYKLKSTQALDKTLQISREIGYLSLELRALISEQDQYLNDNNIESAIKVAKESLILAQGELHAYERAVIFNNLSIAYRKIEEFDKSITALKEAEILYKKIENEQSLLWVLEDYSLTYRASKQYQLALEYYMEFHAETSKLLTKTNNKNVLELQEMYQNQKNLNEIERLNQENQLNQEKFKTEEYQNFAFASFAILLCVFCAIVWNHNRIISNKSKLLDNLNKKLKEQALKDPLTGLYNRRFFNEIEEKLSQTTIRRVVGNADSPNRIGLILLDIDFFKKVNDSFGHDMGDAVIQQISNNLLSATRASDYVIRWGGEEFLIILTDTNSDGIEHVCQKLLNLSNKVPVNVIGEEVNITFSLGYTLFPFSSQKPRLFTLDESLKLVDNFLYIAKHQGRNQAITVNTESFSDETKDLLLTPIADLGYSYPKPIKVEQLKPKQ